MASAQIPLRYRDLSSGSLQFPQGNFPSHGKSAGVDPEIIKLKLSFLFSNLQQKMFVETLIHFRITQKWRAKYLYVIPIYLA